MPDLPKLILGGDPGSSGGIALVSLDRSIVQAWPMPETRKDFADLLLEHLPVIQMAYIEKVRSSPKMGVASAFTFGMNYERLLMACTCLGVPFIELTPGTWQKSFSLKKGGGELGMSQTEKKNDHKRAAQELFPNIKITHAIADALLLAEHGRRVFQGGLSQ